MQKPPVNRYISQTNPQELHSEGPTIEVEIFLPDSITRLRVLSQPFRTEALIDTGASTTGISPEVAKSLNLHPIQQVNVIGAHGIEKSNVYVVNFTFPGSGIVLKDWMVSETKGLSGRPFQMLLGRDVLKNFLFVYDGASGEIGLEFPSNTHPLSKMPWIIKATGGAKQKPDRKKVQSKKKSRRKIKNKSRKKNR